MAARNGATASSDMYRPYFFLSYAHSPPLVDYPDSDPDRWVTTFFNDLTAAVTRYASPRPGLTPGFFDKQIPSGSDWKKLVTRALGAAQVFVPLYSNGYVTKSLPGREWACFYKRAERAGLAKPERRFAPVLWSPLSGGKNPPRLREALALGADKPGYAANGLRALLRIESDSYQAVVSNLAKQIVELAEQSPIAPSSVPDIDTVRSAFAHIADRPKISIFTIETAAPTASIAAGYRDPRGYGDSGVEWQPFAQHQLQLAEYARQVVERLDLEAEVSEIMVRDSRTRRPGIILIDPWFIADDDGRVALESAVQDLPRWVLPLLILDQPDDASTQKFADQVREILNAAGPLPTDTSRRGARGVSSFDAFVSIVRDLAVEAERQYFGYRSGRYQGRRVESPPSSDRPRLRLPGQHDGPAGPAQSPDPLGEKKPDA